MKRIYSKPKAEVIKVNVEGRLLNDSQGKASQQQQLSKRAIITDDTPVEQTQSKSIWEE